MAGNPFQNPSYDAGSADEFSDTPPQSAPVVARKIAPTRDDVASRARQLGVDPGLALSLFTQESSGNWNSVDSPKGARGGMQVMPGTYRSMMGTDAGQRDPWNNMEAGLRYLSYGQKVLNTKDPELLAAGYHAGYDRADLKAGRIPNTSDGMISTRDYARSVSERLRGARKPKSVDDEFSDTPPIDSQFSDTPPPAAVEALKPVEEQSYLDRLGEETAAGYDDMTRSLSTAKWALGGEDDAAIAESLAKSFQEQALKPKTEARKQIDQAYQDVTDAQGVVDTTTAGAKALYTSITNPKETSIEIARNAANALPTLAAGAAGAGTGAALGGGAGALAAGIGAIPGAIAGATLGGRAGMALGTTATELGAEIQDMVQKRLAETKQEPTAQNILAIVSDKGFKDAAMKQGLAKGLTVAAVDQLFLGLGGKIATAPARKIASQELAAQGMDMASRAARKEAFASPAGRAALEAAAPSLGARVGAGTAAIGVDASGEVIGEGLSQKVARGEVDAGDALREGVVGLGQSVVETAAGATIETAKQAAAIARGTATPRPKAAGPLGRATEAAATEEPRVTVTAQDGQVSGTVTGQTADAVEVVGDDGQVYHFKTGAGGVAITPEAPNAPLTKALDGAAAEQPVVEAAPVVEQTIVETAPAREANLAKMTDAELQDELNYLHQQSRGNNWTLALYQRRNAVEAEIEARKPVDDLLSDVRPAKPIVEPAPAKETDPAKMTDEQLQETLDYLRQQAKGNGWTKALYKRRQDIEQELTARKPVDDLFSDVPPTDNAAPEAAPAVLPKDLSGAKPRYSYGKKSFELNFASDFDKAAYIAAQPTKSKRDADYLAFAMQSGLSEDEVRAHGARVRDAIKSMAKDASPGTLKVPEVTRGQDATLTDKGTITEKDSKPAQPDYEQRNADRIAKVKKASSQEEFDAITADENSDTERHFVGTDSLRQAIQDRQFKLKQEAKKSDETARYNAGEWIDVEFHSSPSVADQTAAALAKNDPENEYRVSVGQDDGWQIKKRKKRDEVLQPAPTGDASEEGAGSAQPTQAASMLPKSVSGTSPNPKALERIAAGRAWFNDGVKAKDFIAKNGLNDTHEAVKGKGGRWDIVAKAASAQSSEVSNVTDQRTSGQPAGTEEMGASAGQGQTAAAVQPDAEKEVAEDSALSNLVTSLRNYGAQQSQIDQAVAEYKAGDPTLIKDLIRILRPQEKQDAPGTRINGAAERAAADRLEKLYEQMQKSDSRKLHSRGEPETSAVAIVRDAITELRKPKTVTSVAEVLETAAQRLDKNFGPMADVVREVVESLQGQAAASQPSTLPNATAPEHVQTDEMRGVSVSELKQIAAAFRQRIDSGADAGVTHVFDAPKKNEIVRLQDKVRVYVADKGWMTQAEAKAEIATWKKNAEKQGKTTANSNKVVLSLFDLSGEWSKPWEEAGYQVYRFDIQADPDLGDVTKFSTEFFGDWFGDFDGQDVYAILAACPCTDFAVSGARHFKAKDEDGRTVSSVQLVKKTLAAIEYFKPAVWALENPVGRIEDLTGLPPWRLSFDPNHIGDNYTKKTLIWGRFNGDLPIAPVEPTEGSMMHKKYGGKSMATKNARSVTPEGFAYGFFEANNAIDNPVLAVAGKYDRLDRGLIQKALDSGVTPEQIDSAVEDFYYMDLDDEAANQAIRDLIKPDGGKDSNAPAQSDGVDRNSDAFQMGLAHAIRGSRMEPPGSVIRSKKDKAAYEAGWLEGRRQEDEASASDTRVDVEHSGYVIQPTRTNGKETWEIKGRTYADGIENSGTFNSLDAAKKEVDRVVANEKRDTAVASEPSAGQGSGIVDFMQAIRAAREQLPPGYDIQAERDSVYLTENGTRAVNGLGRNQAGLDEAVRQAKLRAAQNTPPADLFANNKIFTADAVEKARARMRSKLSQLNSGIDPEMVMDGMTIAGAYIEAGVRSFADYAKVMTDDFGPKIKPYLLSFYEAARNYPGMDTEGMTPVADTKAAFDALNAPEDTETSKLDELKALRTSLQDELENQGRVKNASTRQKLDQVNTAIAELEHPEILKAVGGNYRLANNVALALRMSDDKKDPAAAIARALKELVEPYRTNMLNAVLRAIGKESTFSPTGTDNEGTTNEPQKLDQPGSGELEGAQSEAVQGTEQDGQAGRSPEGRSGTDVSGDQRTGSGRVQRAGSVGDDAGEVSTLAARRNARRGGKPRGEAVSGGAGASEQNPSGGKQLDLIPADGTRAQDRADDFIITDEDAIGEGGAKTKFKQNVAAIRLLKQLQAENRNATRDEQAVLAKYVGWGGLPQAFYRDNNEVSKGWDKEAAELKALLTPEELAAAATSTRNAHYTSTEIVSAVWDALKHFGFQGGRVLEPSVGVGNFFGLMPSALRHASQLTGVELDHITGGIAKQLYPQANIQAPVGFQDLSSPDNYFDLAIGNPPFGREGIYDPNRKKISGFSIHNYFFAKSLDTVKPNGVLAMVVTNRLLDSAGDKARAYMAERADFLGAIRLPNNAFAKNAGTEVTTDIIFMRKRAEGEASNGQPWMDVKQFTDKAGKTVPLNEYFIRNPDMMLGEFGAYGSMYSPDDPALVARDGQDTPALLREAVAHLPRNFMDAPTAEPTRETVEPLNDVSHVKIGSVFEQGGEIFERREDVLGKQQAMPVTFPNEKAKERVSGMIKVRDALVAVRGLQLTDGVNDKALANARAGLNAAYDAFVKENGPINGDANKRLMRDDPTWPQLAALENDFDKGISAAVAKKTGEKARAASASKAAIFFKRTQSPYKPPEKANSAKDALVTSLSERGRVDLDYMSSLYGKTPDVIAQELDGLIYEDVPGSYVTREEYLSGNVKKKLAQALELAAKQPRFEKNAEALRAVQPADIEAIDIDVKTGAHWVPVSDMEDFIRHITEGGTVKAIYNPITASWTLSADRIPASVSTQWGTDRTPVMKIMEAAANQKQIAVYDEHQDGTRTLNEAATTAANEKVTRIKAEWKNWLWSDDDRRVRLARIYNDTFNTDVQRDYDGSHLTFPGKVGNDIIQLRPHQANAVWRMVQSGTTLLDHVVGAGKTFTMIAGIMEMRRMGLAKKPMLVVPNHLVGQWAEDFMRLYPGANILAATKKDFEKENRKRLFARIATGDWDAVIVAHSSFGKVEVDPEFQEAFIRQQISDMDTSIAAMRAAEGKNSRNVKQIEKQKTALEEKLKRLFDTGAKDDNLYFSELGVDGVFLDEAHEFKNLGFSTGMQRVAGLGNPAGSNKASDMFMKTQSVLKRTNGRNVVFATGTPISNTMAEMYTMQRYLDYPTLKAQGIAHFDAWAKTFGEVVTDWELSPSGQYKMNSRFAKFVNMPELMQRYQSFGDVINRDDINRQLAAQGKKLPVPKVATGKPENIVVPRSNDQAEYIGVPMTNDNGQEVYPEGSLIWRSEHLPKKAEKGADNMLKIMSDARKAALDMRLIDPSYPDNPDSKVNVAAENIKGIYDQWSKDRGTQLVFIDLSTPKGAAGKERAALQALVDAAAQGDEAAQEKLDAMSPDELLALDAKFSVYDDLKAKLIALGIPESEIAFIHDANTELQKEELFGKVRSGRIRVLFGSTAKMGAGMNVQERLVALHHLDAPWRPSDLEQREGRIIRQGNKLYEADPEGFEVRIMRYATKQTLDSRMWQTIEAKARFIEQVRKGAGNEREIEDIAGEAANSAEMKAASSGNPLILEEMSLRQAIRKLENAQSEHNREQYRIKDRMRALEAQAERFDREAKVMESDAPKAPKEFAVTIAGTTYEKHGEAGEAILKAVDAMLKAGDDHREIGTFGGFKLSLDDVSRGILKKAVLTVEGNGAYQTDAEPGSSATGLALRLQNTVKSLAEQAQRSRSQAETNRNDIPKLEAQVKPWGQEAELADAKARHVEIIDQLRPKKKDQPTPEEPAASRSGLELIFYALENHGGKRSRMLDALSNMAEGERIAYIDKKFFDILEELDDKGLVDIKC